MLGNYPSTQSNPKPIPVKAKADGPLRSLLALARLLGRFAAIEEQQKFSDQEPEA
jgi:hypothetical protein